jgi:hypothetical protein
MKTMATNTGRFFERTIEALERLLSPGLRVELGTKLKDRTTGGERKFDVIVYTPSPHGELIISVECKDHADPVDVAHISDYADKIRTCGVHHGLLVSRSGLTPQAAMKASVNNIEILSFNEDADELWPSWMRARTAVVSHLGTSIHGYALVDASTSGVVPLMQCESDDNILQSDDGTRHSLDSLHRRWTAGLPPNFKDAFEVDKPKEFSTTIPFITPMKLIPRLPDGSKPMVSEVRLNLRAHLRRLELPLRHMSFAREGKNQTLISVMMSDPIELEREKVALMMAYDKTDDGGFSLRPQLVAGT